MKQKQMTREEQTAAIKAIKLRQVIGVYSGKDGRCCCGCSGNHRYPSKYVRRAERNRGYAISPDEINDKQVARVLRLIQENAHAAEYSDGIISTLASIVIGTRVYIAYLA